MLRKRTFTDEVTGEELTTFFESQPFEVDGIKYYPPERGSYNARPLSQRSMLMAKSQNFGFQGAMIRRVYLESDAGDRILDMQNV